MKEYVLTLSIRDPEHPLTPTVLVEAGSSTDNPRALVESVAALADMLRLLKTPERVRDFMRDNNPIIHGNNLVPKGR